MAGTSSTTRAVPRTANTGKAPECDLYIAGHLTHWVQANRSAGQPHEKGVFEGIRDGLITIRFPDRVEQFRNHRVHQDLDVAKPATEVRFCRRYCVLRVTDWTAGEHKVISVLEADEPWRPCSVDPKEPESFEDLAERANERGGFAISGPLVASWLADEDADW